MRAHRTGLALLLLSALTAAACTSSEAGSATTTPSTTTSPPPTTTTTIETTTTVAATTTTSTTTIASTTTSSVAPTTTSVPLDPALVADMEVARTALLTLADFPPDWVENPVDDDGDDQGGELEAQFDVCLGLDGDAIGDVLGRRKVTTGEFTAPDDITSVEHEVILADDEAMAMQAMAEVGIDGAAPCLQEAFQLYFDDLVVNDPDLAASLPEGMTIGAISVERVETSLDPDVLVRYLTTIPFDLDGEELLQFLEVFYFRQGRALGQMSLVSLGTEFDPDGVGFLGGEVLDRLEAIG